MGSFYGLKEAVFEAEGYNDLLNVVDNDTGFVTLKDTLYNAQFAPSDSVFMHYVKSRYLQWVREPCYMVLRNNTKGSFHAILGSKRGNAKYHKRVKERFGALMELPDIQFFKPEEVEEVHQTRLLFITCTYAHAKCLDCGAPQTERAKICSKCGGELGSVSLREAWDRVTADYNRYVTSLRDKYGKISFIRVLEAQKNGYPHIHAIALFESAEFTAFKHDNTWRIAESREVGENWSSPNYQGHGFVDIEAGYSLRGMLSYVVKYLNKMHDLDRAGAPEVPNEAHCSNLGELVSRASLTTLSMLWIHKIRSFAISRDWQTHVNDLIEAKHISRPSPTVFEVNECGELGISPVPADSWDLLGFYHGSINRGSRQTWSTELSFSELKLIKGLGGWVPREAMDKYNNFNGLVGITFDMLSRHLNSRLLRHCPVCGRVFPIRADMESHLREHYQVWLDMVAYA